MLTLNYVHLNFCLQLLPISEFLPFTTHNPSCYPFPYRSPTITYILLPLLPENRLATQLITPFYVSTRLFDLYQNIQHRKYARWKATYIHNCLKNGETPQAGPIGMDEDEEAGGTHWYGTNTHIAVLFKEH